MENLANKYISLISEICEKTPEYGRVLCSLLCSHMSTKHPSVKDNTLEIIDLFTEENATNYLKNHGPYLAIELQERKQMMNMMLEYLIDDCQVTYDQRTFARFIFKNQNDFKFTNDQRVRYYLAKFYFFHALTMNTEQTSNKNTFWTWGTYDYYRRKVVFKMLGVETDGLFNCQNSKQPLKSIGTKMEFSKNQISVNPILGQFTLENVLLCIEEIMTCFFVSEKGQFYMPVARFCLNIVLAMNETHFKGSLDCLEIYIKKLETDSAILPSNGNDSLLYTRILSIISSMHKMDTICEFSLHSRLKLTKRYFYPRMKIPGLVENECHGFCCGDLHFMHFIHSGISDDLGKFMFNSDKRWEKYSQMRNLIYNIENIDQNTEAMQKSRAASAVFVESLEETYFAIGRVEHKTKKLLIKCCVIVFILWILFM